MENSIDIVSNSMTNTRKYYAFVDILKGIAILLIVYGHIIPGTIPALTNWVSTFHIPLFFFVSGMLFNEIKYKEDFKGFVIARTKGLVLPFLYFSVVVALGYILVSEDYFLFVTNLIRNGWGGGYALWFIPVLLIVELVYYPISLLKVGLRMPLLTLCAVLSYFSSLKIGFITNNALLFLCGLWFYGLGNICRCFLKYIDCTDKLVLSSIMLGGIILSMLYIPFVSILPEWFLNKIPSPFYYITPLFAIIGMVGLSIFIEKRDCKVINYFLSTCGKQSFIILAFHQIICMIAQQYVSSKVAILIMILSLTFLVLFIPKYTPWVLGKRH